MVSSRHSRSSSSADYDFHSSSSHGRVSREITSTQGRKESPWTVPLDLVEKFQGAREHLEERERRARQELGRKRFNQEQLVGELLYTLDERERLNRKTRGELYKAWAAAEDQDYVAQQLHRELTQLRSRNNYLEQEQDGLASSNRILRRIVDDLETAAPKVVLKRRAPPIQLGWRLEEFEELRRLYPRTTCVFSPLINDPRLRTRPGELDFYPNGDAKAPHGHCTLALRLPRGTKATLQLFVGEAKTEIVKVKFSDAVREYARHFGNAHGQASMDSVVVGANILWSHRTTKHLL